MLPVVYIVERQFVALKKRVQVSAGRPKNKKGEKMFTALGAIIGVLIDAIIVVCLACAIVAAPFILIAKFLGWLFKWD